MTARLALVGARGYTGAELLTLIAGHPGLQLAAAGSRQQAGQPVPGFDGLSFSVIEPAHIKNTDADCWLLALPNGKSKPYCSAIQTHAPEAVIVDLSADHRFDPDWVYGLPEHRRKLIAGSKRIANPGCYATGMQLALLPLADLLAGPPVCFGVSGYSGAGTTPSHRNDPDNLRDNLLPYGLTDHLHEREAGHYLGRRVRFLPHVAPHFRGILLTIHMNFSRAITDRELMEKYARAYANEPLVKLRQDIPVLRDGQNVHHVTIGGISVAEDSRSAVVVAALDNLLKGAATQAIQNINLALGFKEFSGIL